MPATLAFDVYGTLIDTHGVVVRLRELVGERAEAFSRAWRDKQLEYAFRRGLMQRYADFGICTREALEHTCAAFDAPLSAAERAGLLDLYGALPAFDDARAGLARLEAAGHRLFAFSNGTAGAVAGLLAAAGLDGFFEGIVSTDEVRSFKPDPVVYAHFLRSAGATGDAAWLVSSNPFDVIGARAAGMRAVWVRRSPAAVFDPWGIEPTVTVGGLVELAAAIGGYDGQGV